MATPSFSLLQGDPSTWPLPPAGKTYLGINATGQIVLKQHDGTLSVISSGACSLNKQANNGTVSSLTVTPSTSMHTEIITLTGGARTLPVTIVDPGLSDGARVTILFKFPATTPILVDIFSDIDLLASLQNQTSSPAPGRADFVLDDGDWVCVSVLVPAYTPVS